MDNTNAERQARWRERHKTQTSSVAAELAKARARIAELESATRDEEALRNARTTITKLEARIAELELEATLKQPASGEPELDPLERLGRFKTAAEWDAYREGIKVAKREARQKQQPKPPPKKPQLDPESAAAKQIKSLLTANRNLRTELNYMHRWYHDQGTRDGKMPPATARAIVKCLHPDHAPSMAEREHACKLFNVFMGSTK